MSNAQGERSADDESAKVPTRLLIALGLGASLAPFGSTMIAAALPSMAHDFSLDVVTLTQWVVTSYLLVGIIAQSPGGKIGDMVGHHRTLLFGQIAYGTGTLLSFFAWSMWPLVVGRILSAAGGALIVPSAMAILRNELPPSRRGRAFGLFGSLFALAAAIGPFVGGALTTRYSWRAIFGAVAVPLLLSIVLSRGLPEPAVRGGEKRRLRVDGIGILLLAAALAMLVSSPKMHGTRALVFAGGGAILFIAFVVWERRAQDPVVALSLFTKRAFVVGGSIVALQNLAMYALLFQLPAYFSSIRGIGTERTGRAQLGMMLCTVASAPIGGRLSEKFGARPLVTIGSLLATLGVWLLHDTARLITPEVAIVPLIIFGIGLGLTTAPSQVAALSAIDKSQTGMASGVFSTMRYLGGIVGIALLGAIVAAKSPSDANDRHALAITIFACALALSTLLALLLPGRPTAPTTQQNQ